MEINFHEQKSLKVIFDGDKTAEEIYKRLTANVPGVKLIPGKTLIFLDEIQKCAGARTALKFLAEDGRYDVIASGSLLGLSYGKDDDNEVEPVESIPVGYEKTVMMYSMDFEEFLWAYGYTEETIAYRDRVNEEYYAYIAANGLEDSDASRAVFRRETDEGAYFMLDDDIMGRVLAMFDAAAQ